MMLGGLCLGIALASLIASALLDHEAHVIRAAPLCNQQSNGGCRLVVRATLIGGYDEGSGIAPERQLDVQLADGSRTHLTAPIIGSPPAVGSPVMLEFWHGKLIAFATTAGMVDTKEHPAVEARSARSFGWYAFALLGLIVVWICALVERTRPAAALVGTITVRIGASKWFFATGGVIAVGIGLAPFATDGLTETALHDAFRNALVLLIGMGPLAVGALRNYVIVRPDCVIYKRRMIRLADIEAISVKPKRPWLPQLTLVMLQASSTTHSLLVDTKYWGPRGLAQFLTILADRAPNAHFDQASTMLRAGLPAPAPQPDAVRPWEGQSRGCAMALVGTGAVLMLLAFVIDSIGSPAWIGMVLFDVGSLLAGLGLHRNLRVLQAYFGKARGSLLTLYSYVAPFLAIALDTVAEMSNDPTSRVAFRFLSVLPLFLEWVVIWLPLSKIGESGVASRTSGVR
jgi:hypothetical protein